MPVPQLILDAIRFLLALAAPASLVALVLAGIALRREGTTSFSVGGGGFSKWMFWAIVMITLPQAFGWFAFWGVGAPLPGGGIGNGWMSAFANDAVIFVNTFVIGRALGQPRSSKALGRTPPVGSCRSRRDWLSSGRL